MDQQYPLCENCQFYDAPIDQDPCHECITTFLLHDIKPNFGRKQKPKTNGDRIRAMTDDELATWLGDMLGVYPFGTEQWNSQAWLDWLIQEYNESEVNESNAENATSPANDKNDSDNRAMPGSQEANHL